MERALGEVPNVEAIYFDWRDAVAWVRFVPGKVTGKAILAEAITEKTPYSGGEVSYVHDVFGLPDDLQ